MNNNIHKITIVDKNDNIIGAATKEEAFNKNIIRRISRIFLIDSDKIYLQRRGPKMKLFPNTWDQSAGGHVDKGETYKEAARRELKEELGIDDVKLSELGKFYLEETYEELKTFQFSMVFMAPYNGQLIKFQTDEVSGGKWFDFKEVTEMVDSTPNEFATGFIVAWNKFKNQLSKY